VRANFDLLIRLVALGLPLPFARLTNRRSLVGLGNLSDVLLTCLDHPNAGGETFLVSDGEAPTLPELLEAIGRALHRPARLFGLDPDLLKTLLRLAGGPGLVDRLAGDLVVDATKAERLLSWRPPHRPEQELAATVAARRR